MKRWLLLIFAVLLVLSGCDGEPVPETTQPTTAQTVETTQRIPGPSLYEPDSYLETATQGAVQVFAHKDSAILTYGFMGDDLVLFTRGGTDVIHATRISTETGEILTEGTLSGDADLWDGLALGADSMVCYDMGQRRILFYDGQFRQTRAIAVPENIIGSVVFSEDLSKAYYGLDGTLRELDLHTEISRLLMQTDGAGIYPSKLLFGDTVLYCYVDDAEDTYDGFFSVADGRMLDRVEGLVTIKTLEDQYVASYSDGPMTEILLGSRGGEVRSFRSDSEFAQVDILGKSGRLVENQMLDTGTCLQIYDPETGNCLGKVFLEGFPWAGTAREDARGLVWFLATDYENEVDILCRWDPEKNPESDSIRRIGTRYTVDNPDPEGLARCEEWARELENKYGVDIVLYKDFTEPFDYAFTPEHQIRLVETGLEDLEYAMSCFPEGFFRTAAGVTESGTFHISLVREMTGTEYNTLPDADGLQYWIDGNAYIALATGNGVEMNFYHELCHALETFVIANSIHYDFWENNNPKDFTYDYSYTDYLNRWESPWLQDETRAFIDAYSMTYPIEDRARILEYAITEGNESYFTTDAMQAKLKQLCMAIREAFGWEKSQEAFLWEQYLREPLQHK